MSNFSKVLSLLSASEIKKGGVILVLSIFLAVFESMGILSILPFFTVISNPDLIDTNQFLSSAFNLLKAYGVKDRSDFLIYLGSASLAVIFFTSLFRAYTSYSMNIYIEMLRHKISSRLVKNYLSKPYDFYLNRHSADLSKTILSEVDQFIGNVVRPLITMISYSFVLISITILVFIVNPLLASIAALLLGGFYSVLFLFLKSRLLTYGEIRTESNKMRFIIANECFSSIKEMKLLHKESVFLKRYKAPSEKLSRVLANFLLISQLPNYLVELVLFTIVLVIVAITIFVSGDGSVDSLSTLLPTLGLFMFSALRLKPSIQNIYQGLSSLRYSRPVIDNLYYEFQGRTSTSSSIKSSSIVSRIKPRGAISLKNVGFSYPEADSESISNVSLELKIGDTIGVVGSSGAGKTTFVDLLLGLLQPTSGCIYVDGRPVDKSTLSSWQASLGYVPQDIRLLDATVAENIAFGVDSKEIDFDRVSECARIAELDTFIDFQLAGGYHSKVGERGVKLSGGQRQRIAIARALYHDPDVVIFDEATSALDNLTEAAVMSSIDKMKKNKTLILVAHRLSTIKKCDQIILLDCGKVVAIGKYDDLVKTNSFFKSLAEQ